MRFCAAFIIITLVRSLKITYDGSSSSEENMIFIPHVETTLDFRGFVRRLFILELGLNLGDDNIICSPIAVLMPLAKLVFGAKRKSRTKTELLEAIGLKGRTEVKNEYRKIIKKLKAVEGVDINLASKLYISRQSKLMSKFVTKVETVFGSGIEVLDFGNPRHAANKINHWFLKHTRNKIKYVISPNAITPMDSMILANAIHFKGYWKHAFNPAGKIFFYSPRGNKIANMMTRSGQYNYIRNDELNAQVVEIPYNGGECAMVIVLPYAKNGLPILLRTLKLSPRILNNALMKMKTATLRVTIPKFKIETSVNLMKYYKKMGIKYTLDPERSDLENIVKDDFLYISSAVHKAVIEVSEHGTVSSAKQWVYKNPFDTMLKRIDFVADHPFLFYIKFNKDQLFAGIFSSP